MTAVEFLLRELGNKFPKEVQDLYYNNKEEFASICSKAKEMEKQQKGYSELVDLLERLTPIYKEDSDLHQKYDKQRLNFIEQFKNK
jgi:hypothetical protein